MPGESEKDGERPGPESDRIETVEVYRTHDRYDFFHVCNALESAGIRFVVSDEALSGLLGITIDGLGVKRILVKTTDLEKAAKVIEDLTAN